MNVMAARQQRSKVLCSIGILAAYQSQFNTKNRRAEVATVATFKQIIIFEHVCPQQVAGVCVALKPPATERIRSLQWKCDEIEVFSLNYGNADTGS